MDINAARIMVVDDTPANLEIQEELLSRKGYRVSSFPRGGYGSKFCQEEYS